MKFRIFVELKGKESLRKKKKKKESAIRIEREWREIRRGCEHTEALTCGPPVVGNSSTPTSAQWSF